MYHILYSLVQTGLGSEAARDLQNFPIRSRCNPRSGVTLSPPLSPSSVCRRTKEREGRKCDPRIASRDSRKSGIALGLRVLSVLPRFIELYW